jgi:hypothetical protein
MLYFKSIKIMSSITGINNDTIEYNCSQNVKTYICEIFNMTRDSTVKNNKYLLSKLQSVWDYDEGITLVALMFYTRNIRKYSGLHDEYKHGKGKGEKILSYTILLWLLENYEKMFIVNYMTFIHLGYYKDCLLLASMAKQKKIHEYKVIWLLEPMAIALLNDAKNLNIAQQSRNYEKINMSLAAKWAPRQGKAYSHCIPYLKQMCGITGSKSDMKWRKYIRRLTISSKTPETIETLLSSDRYKNINFHFIPIKAFNLYKNKFKKTPELSAKYYNFLQYIEFSKNYKSIHKPIYDVVDVSLVKLNKLEPDSMTFYIISKYIPLVNGIPTSY